jgi:hypothetical protein
MATRTRSRVNLKTYPEQLERFLAQYMEAVYRQLAGLDEEMGLAAIYAEHADLFSTAAIDALRERGEKDDEGGREARELLANALSEHVAAAVADQTEQIEVAEARAAIMWRGERIPYRQVPNAAADVANRIERNALYDSYLEAVEAINPIREARLATVHETVRGLGYADVPAMVAATAGFDPDALADELRLFLAESETVYFAALRRFLAEIDIEQGDASRIDLEHIVRGEGWDRWFEAHRMLPAFRATLAGLGIDLDAQPSILLDIQPRPQKSARAFCAPVNVPNDVRLVIQPRGGWDDYAALLHEGGHAEHFAHVDPALPVPWRLLGDNSLTEGYGLLFERLVGEPAWLRQIIGMPDDEAAGFADFNAFWYLRGLRGMAASLLYQLNLHRSADQAIAREEYAGLMGLTLGVRWPPESYLEIDDNLYVARYARAAMVAGSLSAWLQGTGGEAWWTSREAGEALKRSWARGQEWNAQDVVAHLGYDHLDWRPVLRQIRTQLIGEMSGYGGPNITTRAGTRKV